MRLVDADAISGTFVRSVCCHSFFFHVADIFLDHSTKYEKSIQQINCERCEKVCEFESSCAGINLSLQISNGGTQKFNEWIILHFLIFGM